MASNQLPTWKDNDGKEVQAVRITRMVEFEQGKFRIEHDEPHVEPITVGKEFVDKAGGLQQEGFYVKDDQGARWLSAAHFEGGHRRQKQEYDETPEKGFVSADAKASSGPELNRPTTQRTPAELAQENQQKLLDQAGLQRPDELNTQQQTQQAAQARNAAAAAQAPGQHVPPTERALEHETKDAAKHSRHR